MDTGADVNIIRRGIIPTHLLRKAEVPITLSTADSSAIQGGKLGVSGLANLRGHERDLKTPTDVQCPIHFYEAVIAAEAILSYGWLGQHNFHIIPRNHCLEFRDENTCVWISGLSFSGRRAATVKRSNIQASEVITRTAIPHSAPDVKSSHDMSTSSTIPVSTPLEPLQFHYSPPSNPVKPLYPRSEGSPNFSHPQK